MRKAFCLPLMLLLLSGFHANILDAVRANYGKLSSDKELCKEMMENLEQVKQNSATHLAYLGALQAIWANHVFNPIHKINTFEEGKKNIELAVQKEPGNVELRAIRLSIQKNAPSFLGYRAHITEDTEFIRQNKHRICSMPFFHHIEKIIQD